MLSKPRNLVVSLLCLLLFVLFPGISQNPKARVARQLNSKNILVKESMPEEPVVITEVSLNENPLTLNQPFENLAGWESNLRIRVANITNKTITRLDIDLLLPPLTSDSVLQGIRFSSKNQDTFTKLSPNQEIELVAPNSTGPKTSFVPAGFASHKATLSVAYVYFDDNTSWHFGMMHKKDSQGIWRPLGNNLALNGQKNGVKKATWQETNGLRCTHQYQGFQDRQCSCTKDRVTVTCIFQEDILAPVGGEVANCRLQTASFSCNGCYCPVARVQSCGRPIDI